VTQKNDTGMQDNNADVQFNKKVTITGMYAKSNIAKRGAADNSGHYKIIVNESLEVILLPPYLKEAVRPTEEVKNFEGKKVTVTGIIMANTAFSEPSLENQPITVNIPCFITIESIELAKTERTF
jgi:hypothetical protein